MPIFLYFLNLKPVKMVVFFLPGKHCMVYKKR